MTSVSWHRLARRELFEASAFYNERNEGLGEVFLDEVQVGLDRVALHPRAGREVLRGIRRFLIARFPYSLDYVLEERGEAADVFILAVAHQKRHPWYWVGRAE